MITAKEANEIALKDPKIKLCLEHIDNAIKEAARKGLCEVEIALPLLVEREKWSFKNKLKKYTTLEQAEFIACHLESLGYKLRGFLDIRGYEIDHENSSVSYNIRWKKN